MLHKLTPHLDRFLAVRIPEIVDDEAVQQLREHLEELIPTVWPISINLDPTGGHILSVRIDPPNSHSADCGAEAFPGDFVIDSQVGFAVIPSIEANSLFEIEEPNDLG